MYVTYASSEKSIRFPMYMPPKAGEHTCLGIPSILFSLVNLAVLLQEVPQPSLEAMRGRQHSNSKDQTNRRTQSNQGCCYVHPIPG